VTFSSANARTLMPSKLPMLGAVRQWRGWPRAPGRAPDRWRAWASGHRDRLARLDRARLASRMALLQPPRGDAVTGTRGHGVRVATHLHLAVGPVVAPERPAGRGRPGHGGRRPAGRMMVRRLGRAPWPGGPAVATGPPHRAPRTLAAGPRAGRVRADTPVRRVTGELVARVAGTHRRVERPARGAAVLRERGGVATAVDHAPAAGPAAGSPSGPPPVDLDHLTDQILNRLDNRLTAHRERFGRAF
jgi:hypothetical protein